jgi:hypothetical protein
MLRLAPFTATHEQTGKNRCQDGISCQNFVDVRLSLDRNLGVGLHLFYISEHSSNIAFNPLDRELQRAPFQFASNRAEQAALRILIQTIAALSVPLRK